MLTFYFSGAEGWMTEPEILTAGMVGKQVKFEFSEEWDTMIKTAVFSDGVVIRDVALNGDTAVIPAEVLAHPLRPFFLGIYGASNAQAAADEALTIAQSLSTSKLDAFGITTRTITAVTDDGSTVTLNVLVQA